MSFKPVSFKHFLNYVNCEVCFCKECNWGHISAIFVKITSLYWPQLYLEDSLCNILLTRFRSLLAKCKQHCELRQKEQVQQASLFRRHTLMFYLSTTYSRNSFKTVLDNWLLRSLHCRNNRATRSFLINTVSTMSKLLTPNTYYWSRNVSTMSKLLTRNTYYWSRKTLVTIH